MMFEFLKSSTHSKLETIIQRLRMNMENNYKDAAQLKLQELEELFGQLRDSGALNSKQIQNYESQIDTFRDRLRGFTHKDQKPTWV